MRSASLGTHQLAGGASIRLRLPHARDAAGMRELARVLDAQLTDLEAQRALRFDPRTRVVIVATAWTGGAESLVGVAAADLDVPAAPDLLLADPELEELAGLLVAALDGRAAAHARRVA